MIEIFFCEEAHIRVACACILSVAGNHSRGFVFFPAVFLSKDNAIVLIATQKVNKKERSFAEINFPIRKNCGVDNY